MKIKKFIFIIVVALLLICTSCNEKKCKHETTKWIVDKEATCEVTGLKHEECTACGEKLNEETIVSLGHKESNWIVDYESDCVNDGLRHKKCLLCGDKIEEETIKTLGHDLEHHNKKEATCTESGYEAYDTCTRCDYTTYKKIDELGHSYSNELTFDKNTHYYECTCGEKKQIENHNFIWIIDKEPSEEENGLKHEECEMCKYIRSANTLINKLEHTHNIEHFEFKEATCTESGNQEYYYCTKCKMYYLDSKLTKETSYDNIIIDAHHELIHYDYLAPTCTEKGHNAYDKCINCDYTTYKKIDELGHNASNWITDNDATCTQVGTKHIECTMCHIILENGVIEKYGHNYENNKCIICNKKVTLNLEFELHVDEYGVAGIGTCTDTEIYIPDSYNGLKVTSIDDSAFQNCSRIFSVEIPNSVISIGWYAFDNCCSLNSVAIPNSVSRIGNFAFRDCSSLENIEILNNKISIGYETFSGCSSLKNVYYGGSIEDWCNIYLQTYYISSYPSYTSNPMFYANYFYIKDKKGEYQEVTEIEIPDTITKIEANRFRNFTTVKKLVIPSTITIIGENAFFNCCGLVSVIIDNNNKVYDSRENCNSIIETSTNKLILGCNNTIIPSSVTSIGENAFWNCANLESIIISENVESIGSWSFIGCSGLETIIIDENNKVFDSRENCNAIIKKSTNMLMAGCKNTVIPNSVTSIGEHAFYNCSSLTSIEIPNSVTSIGYLAFYNCSSLTSIEIPNSVTSIGSSSFEGCTSLESIIVDKNNKVYDSRENCNAIIKTSYNSLILGCKNTIIPNSVISIGSDAFRNCSSLTSIEIPNSVTSIGSWAFLGCRSLISIIFEEKSQLTSIGQSAFSECRGLTSITIPNSVTSIGAGAFSGCTSLTSIVIPSSVTSIDSKAFAYCINLTSIEIPNSVNNIYYNIFIGCNNLTIYCEHTSRPGGWKMDWNSSNCPVIWNYKEN